MTVEVAEDDRADKGQQKNPEKSAEHGFDLVLFFLVHLSLAAPRTGRAGMKSRNALKHQSEDQPDGKEGQPVDAQDRWPDRNDPNAAGPGPQENQEGKDDHPPPGLGLSADDRKNHGQE